jgi:septal ring-binding cell division protein DamX
VRGRAVPLIAALAAGLACAGPYAERPPAADPGRETAERPPAEADRTAGAGSEGTVVGHVTPDGRIQADTIVQAPAPEPVERETVVTGHVRPATAAPVAAASDAVPVTPRPATGAIGSVPGWRVQVFAARDEATANEVARRAGDLVPGVPVYVVAEESWYKVRLGDFASRQAAEPLRERLIGLGWTEAWTVRTGIHAP